MTLIDATFGLDSSNYVGSNDAQDMIIALGVKYTGTDANRPYSLLPSQGVISHINWTQDLNREDGVAYIAGTALTNSVVYAGKTYSTGFRGVLWQSGSEYVYTLIIEALRS